jgi:type II secretory ATPase GspE/PulE/Tfp pilus assembly ATPase PilB-like protein
LVNWDADTLAPEAVLRASAAAARPAHDLLPEIVAEALRRGASRIHLEPAGAELRVRFRIGGQLVEALRLPWGSLSKIESGIHRIHGREISVAVMPVGEWQRTVLHLGAPDTRAEGLEALGMRPPLVQALSAALARGSGLVLVAGPPGSGKTRTLAALMAHLDNGSRCLLGIEAGWGAVLRQDPDVILAGSIATRESAAMAVQAAEAGHLVLAAVPPAMRSARSWRCGNCGSNRSGWPRRCRR